MRPAQAPGSTGLLLVFVADQGIVSATRFALAWWVARSTAPENYGAYALLLSILLVLEVVQQALVTWPLAVLVAAQTEESFRSYVATLARVQGLLALVLGAAVVTIALLLPAEWLNGRPLANGCAAAGLLIAQQCQEFSRRVLLTRKAFGALVNDALVLLLVGGGLWLLSSPGLLAGDVPLASHRVLAFAGAAFAVGAVVGWLQTRSLRARTPDRLALTSHLREVWQFGRWILGSRLGEGMLSHALNFVVASFGGAAATAALEAPRLLLAPIHVAAFGVINFMMTRGARALEAGGTAALRASVRQATLVGGGAFAAYAAVLAWHPQLWLFLVYGGRYQDSVVLWAWCAGHVLFGTRLILSTALYLMRRTELLMQAMLVSGVSALLLAVPLSAALSARGAAYARVAGEALLLALTVVLTRRVTAASAPARP